MDEKNHVGRSISYTVPQLTGSTHDTFTSTVDVDTWHAYNLPSLCVCRAHGSKASRRSMEDGPQASFHASRGRQAQCGVHTWLAPSDPSQRVCGDTRSVKHRGDQRQAPGARERLRPQAMGTAPM